MVTNNIYREPTLGSWNQPGVAGNASYISGISFPDFTSIANKLKIYVT